MMTMLNKNFVALLLAATLITGATALMTAAPGDSRISEAAMQGDKITVRTLVQQKVDVNVPQGDGTTALHWAAYRDDVEMAQLLIKAGADVKAATRVGSMTPLFMAAKNGSAAMIQLLITAGADVNSASTSTGTTPLMLAAAAGKADAVKALVEKGANVNAKDLTNGQTALMFAASLNRDEAIRVLTGRGADMKATSKVSPVAEDARRGGGEGRRGRAPVVMGGNTALLFAARDGQL